MEISFLGCKPLTSKIDTDFYTGKFVDKCHRTVEHITPKSKGGRSNIKNYAMTDSYINSKRSNTDMQGWLDKNPSFLDNMKNYVKKYFKLKILGINHGEEIAKTVKKKYNIDLLA